MAYIRNPYLNTADDVLFHLKFSNKDQDLEEIFGDTKFVCLGGTQARMRSFAELLMKELHVTPLGGQLEDLTGKYNRYSMFKVGPIVCVNHGMGIPSITILLHELFKLMSHAKAKDPIFIRIGTAGGIDVDSGSVIIANEVINDYLEPCLITPTLGKEIKIASSMDKQLYESIKNVAEKNNIPAILGTIVSSLLFYEALSMKASAICEKSDQERNEYAKRLRERKVLGMDMEGLALSALSKKVGIKCALCLVVVNDCFAEENDTPSPEITKEWEMRAPRLALEFIRQELNL